MNPETYESLKEEVSAALTEGVFNTRYAAIEMHHNIGRTIREHTNEKGITNLLTKLAVDLGTSERTLFRAVELFDKYPDLSALPDGKNVSMNKLLGSGKAEEPKDVDVMKVATSLVTRYGASHAILIANMILSIIDEKTIATEENKA